MRLSLHQGSTENCKTQEQNFVSQITLLILTVSKNAFHSTNLFCHFSCYQALTNGIAPSSVHKPHTTHSSSIRSEEGLMLEMSAFKSLYVGQFTLSTQLTKPNYLVIIPPMQHHSFFRTLPPLLLLTLLSYM